MTDLNISLQHARKYEREAAGRIEAEERPAFHFTPPAGWMNDPNGFSYYQGKFHLFFQYFFRIHPTGIRCTGDMRSAKI